MSKIRMSCTSIGRRMCGRRSSSIEVKPGMDELQADFAVGMGVPDAGTSSDEKTVRYPNGGKPLVVNYQGGKATEIKAGT